MRGGRQLGLLVSIAAFAVACFPAPSQADPLQASVVLPPGEGNTITTADYAQNQAQPGCGGLGPHTCDQMSMYENWGFRSAPLSAAPADVPGAVSSEQPEAGVTIVRDNWGVPHVFATGADETQIEGRLAYGIGYAQAEERLFQMEVLRRAAEGRLAQLLGPSYVQMDELTLRDSETDAERQAELATLSPANQAGLQDYADGINAVIARDSNDPSQMPAGFQLLQDVPIARWTPSDTLAIIILEVHGVAESAGDEVGYGSLARRLAAHYGTGRAVRILDDLQFTGDHATPTTIPHDQRARQTSDRRRYSFIRYKPADTARQIGALGPSVEPAFAETLSGDRVLAQARRRLGLPVFGSNAWAIAPSRSATHHPLLWGAPQVNYYVPEIFDELEVQGGLSHARGVGVPGGGPGVVVGYTRHTAWSITTAQDDQVDTYVDRIRAAPGGGYQYFWRGGWHPVEQRTVTITVRNESPNFPIVGTLPTPTYTQQTLTLYRTVHGNGAARQPCIVFYLDPSAGLSYCKVRAYWGAELKVGLSIVHANQATGLSQFAAAARQNTAGFNFVYADDRGNIGYWHTGRVPLRVAGHDPRLPVPGGGSFDWRGYLSPKLWPSVVDPAQGWIASWNNKPQFDWPDSGDGSLWGAFQRVREPMSLLAAHRRRFTLADAWHVARRTGELDLRFTLGFERFITALARRGALTPLERAAVSLVAHWDGTAFGPDGTELDSSGQPDGKVRSPAFAIMDAWFAALERRVATPVFGPAVSGAGADAEAGVRYFTQTPATVSPQYEFFDNYDQFVYDVLAGRTAGHGYLGGASASAVSLAALGDAVHQLSAAQGTDPSKWRAPMPQINFMALDVSSIPSIPWENRGTWGEAIALR
jgi:penicillin amidase